MLIISYKKFCSVLALTVKIFSSKWNSLIYYYYYCV